MGEYLTATFLSRKGWETVHVDHAGIDLLAARGGRILGISVKSRYHDSKMKGAGVNVFSKKAESQAAMEKACQAFRAEPWLAVYHEIHTGAQLILMSVEHYRREYDTNKPRAPDDVKTSSEYLRRYRDDPLVGFIEFEFKGPSGEIFEVIPTK